MNKRRQKKSLFAGAWHMFAVMAVFGAVLALILSGLADAGRAAEAEGRHVAEEAIRRAAVCCYAVEGAYPESYEYLRDNYGLRINEELYYVSYSVFASNMMPDITVLERGGAS